MTTKTFFKLIIVLLVTSTSTACTIGVANGNATYDGRPILWKTRDTDAKNNEVIFCTSDKYNYIALISAGNTNPWMGVNEKGFAIINSNSKDLKKYPKSQTGPGHSAMMKLALETCLSVADFEKLLKKTNTTGRKTSTNFGVIDANGNAAIFETANKQYWKLDTDDTDIAPHGYIVHSNFAFNGDGKNGFEKAFSYERYKRANDLCKGFYESNKINYKEVLQKKFRDFADYQAKPIQIPFADKQDPNAPFGYINTHPAICRYYTTSAVIFVGVLPQEDPRLSTMWTILAMPATGIAVPYWPVGKTPVLANGSKTAPLCDIARKINDQLLLNPEEHKKLKNAKRYYNSYLLRDAIGQGLLSMIFPPENKIIEETEKNLEKWRHETLDLTKMLALENKLAAQAFENLKSINEKLKTRKPVR